MTRIETQQLLEIVFLYRPFFKSTLTKKEDITRLIDEWYEKLNDYEYKDIKQRLDDFFRDEATKIPTPFDLMKDVRTLTQKSYKGKRFIYCDVCKKPLEVFVNKERTKIDRTEADKHIDRCHSVRYIQQLYHKWWNRTMTYEETKTLKEMSKDNFNAIYYNVLEKAYNKMADGTMEKFLAKKVLDTRYQ